MFPRSRSATSAVAAAAAMPRTPAATTAGATRETRIAPGRAANASSREGTVSRLPNHSPEARVAYVTTAMPRMVTSAASLMGALQKARQRARRRSKQDIPVARKPPIGSNGDDGGKSPGNEDRAAPRQRRQ